MAETPPRKNRRRLFTKKQISDTRIILHTVFPKCFMDKGADKIPLKIGINADLRKAFPEIRRKLLSATLEDYTSGLTYLRSVVTGASRVDLDGNFAGVVTADQSEYSAKKVAAIMKSMERRKKGRKHA